MNTEQEIKQLEEKIISNISNLNNKLDNYSKKINHVIVDGKKQYNSSLKISSIFSFKNIGIIFAIIYAICYFALQTLKPGYVTDKIKNPGTHFIENNISTSKIILFSFAWSLGIVIVLFFSYYIYSLKGI
jgi:hypothetical protein